MTAFSSLTILCICIYLYAISLNSSFLSQNACKVRIIVVTLQRDCGLITPATGLKPWVHILIKAIVSSVT